MAAFFQPRLDNGWVSCSGSCPREKPNILFIMGDDIGWMQPSIYHQGLAVGETPNIDRIGNEGARFMTYYAEQSCTAGRTAFITGMQPLRVGMTLPEIPGSPSYLRTGTPHLAKFLNDLGYTTGEFGKNHLGDTTQVPADRARVPGNWGYLYHLDAMQAVSFPDFENVSALLSRSSIFMRLPQKLNCCDDASPCFQGCQPSARL